MKTSTNPGCSPASPGIGTRNDMASNISNPFTIASTEKIEDDKDFVNLFEPSILSMVSWDSVLKAPIFYWLSAQGAGKSSLLRLFSPSVLCDVLELEKTDPLRKMVLKHQLVDQETGPRVLGMLTKSPVSFGFIQSLPYEEVKRKRMFYALLDARACLRFLRSASIFARLPNYPHGLDKLEFTLPPNLEGLPSGLDAVEDGAALHEWARGVERACLQAIDAFDPSIQPPGHDYLLAQHLCDPTNWRFEGRALPPVGVLMIDDAQDLAPEQRKWLGESVTRQRQGCRVWVAARAHAMAAPALLEGVREGRDYMQTRLERIWTRSDKSFDFNKYRTFLENLGNRRIRRGGAVDRITSISDLVAEGEPGVNDDLLETLRGQVEGRIGHATKGIQRFDKWLDWARRQEPLSEKVQCLREVEILIQRDLNSGTDNLHHVGDDLIPDQPYGMDILHQRRSKSDLRRAAAAFLARDSVNGDGRPRFPLYYGFDVIARMSGFNVHQFMALMAALYDSSLQGEISGRGTNRLAPIQQDRILREASITKWESLRSEIKESENILNLLTAMSERLQDAFLLANAPYSPGPTGISIPEDEYQYLQTANLDSKYEGLKDVLVASVGHNLLHVTGRKDKSKPVRTFYLNPILLPRFGLPVITTQFQPSSLEELRRWLEVGYEPTHRPGKSQARRRRKQKQPRLPSSRGSQRIDDFLDDEYE